MIIKTISIVNGPNLNFLGIRELEKYGSTSYTELVHTIENKASSLNLEIKFFQSNNEGEIVDYIQRISQFNDSWLIFNPGAFTHTSIALRDALLGVSIPFIEIHISNVFSREDFRKKSYLSDIAVGVISGHGIFGYELALMSAVNIIKNRK